jgi:hypothetical protein
MACITKVISGVFWNLGTRTLMAAMMVFTNCFGTGYPPAKSIQTSAFLR